MRGGRPTEAERVLAVLPPSLPPGGRIGVVAPSSPVPADQLERGVAALQALGFQVVTGKHVLEQAGHHAGKPQARAADLHAMFSRPDVHAIFCARGGSSAIRVLEHLDYELIRNCPKVFVGYSDVTTLLLALWAQSGLRTFFGPMVTPDWAAGLAPPAQDVLWRLICHPRPAGVIARVNHEAAVMPLVGGRAAGLLIGGTLALVAATIGTPEQINLQDRIFCFEDIHESPARIERYLTQLTRAGILSKAAGFLVGPLKWDATDEEQQAYHSFERVLRDCLEPLGRPTLIGVPFGHVPSPLTLPLGIRVELDADAQVVRVLEAAVR
jgi:muramoyltetrapeptide carboxypeptidase